MKLPLSSRLLSSLSSPSSCRAGNSRPFFFRVNELAGLESDRLANIKIISLPRETESESSEIVSSSCLYFCRVWLREELKGNCLDLVAGILPYVEIWDIRAAVIEEMLNKKKKKNLDYTIKSQVFRVEVEHCETDL